MTGTLYVELEASARILKEWSAKNYLGFQRVRPCVPIHSFKRKKIYLLTPLQGERGTMVLVLKLLSVWQGNWTRKSIIRLQREEYRIMVSKGPCEAEEGSAKACECDGPGA